MRDISYYAIRMTNDRLIIGGGKPNEKKVAETQEKQQEQRFCKDTECP